MTRYVTAALAVLFLIFVGSIAGRAEDAFSQRLYTPELNFGGLGADPAIPWWAQGKRSEGPMPSNEALLAAIMANLHPECAVSDDKTHLYLCESEIRNTYASYSLPLQAKVDVKRMDGRDVPIASASIGRNIIRCDPRKAVVTPLERGFDQICFVNAVAEKISFRLIVTDQPILGQPSDDGSPPPILNEARLMPGSSFWVG